jgi:SAM-dependent methyltransferase
MDDSDPTPESRAGLLPAPPSLRVLPWISSGSGFTRSAQPALGEWLVTEGSGAEPFGFVEVPNGARIYDYMLGGKDNYLADRMAAQAMLDANPAAWRTAQANRAFLGRAVRVAATEGGVRQFLDIGTGLPTQQNVHEVAQDVAPDSRTVYVDNDAVVIAHANGLLAATDGVAVVDGDLRRPGEILAHPGTRRLIDFSRPVAVLLVAVLHFVDDEDDPAAILRTLREAMAPGSYLIISHTIDESTEAVTGSARAGFQRAGSPLFPRTRARVLEFFEGFELLEPGLVDVQNWRPGDTEEASGSSAWVLAGAVGRLAP